MSATLVTGGAGFIGSNFVRQYSEVLAPPVIIIDSLTYAGNMNNIAHILGKSNVVFVKESLSDRQQLGALFRNHSIGQVIHFAAETHVDRSIDGPAAFVESNIVGTFALLEAARTHFQSLPSEKRQTFRFLHVSTDEVFGSLGHDEPGSNESTPYRPNSPYSASKAAADHLVRAWFRTYGLPTLTVNCSNNYGPYQFPEKLIPLIITRCLSGKTIPIFGDGSNVRDWLFVEDNCRALLEVLLHGEPGETYNIGGRCERTNLQVARHICTLMDHHAPSNEGSHARLIKFVEDRPGHDYRYSLDIEKIEKKLDWRPIESFETGMQKTVLWYLENRDWVNSILTKPH